MPRCVAATELIPVGKEAGSIDAAVPVVSGLADKVMPSRPRSQSCGKDLTGRQKELVLGPLPSLG